MKEEIKELISESDVKKRCEEIATKINNDFGDEPIYLLCILKGSMIPASPQPESDSEGYVKNKKTAEEPVWSYLGF